MGQLLKLYEKILLGRNPKWRRSAGGMWLWRERRRHTDGADQAGPYHGLVVHDFVQLNYTQVPEFAGGRSGRPT